ncbi:MAG: hypothetical protein DLM67_16755 [Candidatus Nephthysia bennettiae]|uniref:Universal stress protein n=1 Tax=Candidatus Nephthysia bennettiae TaxID=3127016 RepID=A0A934K5G5_9BACT|nr:universal stress protein [Candidatus Dormibacteraeota bacterium]MBJ7613469.1 universal stress protein [Candidatus Dormibacteraeota bacterium]PZR91135.1 MAG: hypothetical protein DLM67_16755 [Candidatus Dormibacteraeota bacterium]
MLTGQTAETRSRRRRVTLLLEGDVSELMLLRVGERARSEPGLEFDACLLADDPRPGLELVTAFAGGLDLRRLGWPALQEELRKPRQAVFVAPPFWRRHGRALWPALGTTAVYVCRRGRDRVERLLVGADCLPTGVELLGWLDHVPRLDGADRTVVQAIPPPPSWAMTMLAAGGVPYLPAAGEEPPADAGRWLVRNQRPERALCEACLDFAPDLVVLGWHAHSLPLPAPFLHSLAWRLSLRLPTDVLLVPLGA